MANKLIVIAFLGTTVAVVVLPILSQQTLMVGRDLPNPKRVRKVPNKELAKLRSLASVV